MQKSLDNAVYFYPLRDNSMKVAAIISDFKTDVIVQSSSIWTPHASVDRNKKALGWHCANYYAIFSQTIYVTEAH